MHFDFTLHIWSAAGYLSSLATGCTFLWQTYKQIRRGVNAFVLMIEQHHEMYGWYARSVKPRQQRKANGLGVH